MVRLPTHTSARILEAATNQFFERWYHAASTKEVAEEAGVRPATLYYHFPNKEAMLVEIMRTTLGDLTSSVRTAGTRNWTRWQH